MRPRLLLARFAGSKRPFDPGEPDPNALVISLLGDDTNDGTEASPYRSFLGVMNNHAWDTLAGRTIYLRGGVYNTIGTDVYYDQSAGNLGGNISQHVILIGQENNRITVKSYPGEWAILDGSNHSYWPRSPLDGGSTGNDPNLLRFYGQYVDWSDMEFRYSVGKGLSYRGFYNTFTNMYSHGANIDCFYGQGKGNVLTNCDAHDSYNGQDETNSGDGFKLAAANQGSASWTYHDDQPWFTGEWATIEMSFDQVFRRCRSWNNYDDGFDSISAERTTWEECISSNNGFGGNAQGFKLAGSFRRDAETFVRYSIAAFNGARGFDSNGGTGITMHNNTAWNNDRGFWLQAHTAPADGSEGRILAFNNVAYENVAGQASGLIGDGPAPDHHNNTWNLDPEHPDPQWVSTDPTSVNFLALGGSSPALGAGTVNYTKPESTGGSATLTDERLSDPPDLGALQLGETFPLIGVVRPDGPANPLGPSIIDTTKQGGTLPVYE